MTRVSFVIVSPLFQILYQAQVAFIIRPEHTVELFRLLGGGVVGDLVGLPRSRLAVLPGTTHITLVDRSEWLVSMITEFLDASLPKAK